MRPPAGRIPPARGALGRARDRLGYTLIYRFWDGGLRSVNLARAAYGLTPLAHLWEQWDRAQRVLVLTGSAFDDPQPDAANVTYVGPVLEDLPADGAITIPSGAGPLILVGLSSSYMKQAALLRRIARALASMPVRAIITTGPAIDPAEIPATGKISVVRSAPHMELLPQTDLVITHAGHGTLIKAITAGVPSLCIPLGRDQPDNAARAARHGVARVISPRSDARQIARAVLDILAEPRYRQAAVALGERVRAEADSGALLRELEALPREEFPSTPTSRTDPARRGSL